MELKRIYEKNKGIAPLFSKFIIVDWYDGMVTGAAKLVDTNKWYLCNLCYFDPDKAERIYTLVETSEQQVLQLGTFANEDGHINKEFNDTAAIEIKNAFRDYSGKAYLMKVIYLGDFDYSVVEFPLSYLMYFNDVEDVINQDEKSKLRWLNYFVGH